uniref:Cytochrome c oxidase subunit 3 n=1 Tax=Hebesoma violentum TaxID=1410563 RepID=A0A0C4JQJ7_9BILA|nr:cytochrome c oxidase subunit III [Hebesoma violentum]
MAVLSFSPVALVLILWVALVGLCFGAWGLMWFMGLALITTLGYLLLELWASGEVTLCGSYVGSGMIIFILSEVFVFMGVLASFLYSSYTGFMGSSGEMLSAQDVWLYIPLLSSCLLLSSGVSVTVFHGVYLVGGSSKVLWLSVTLVLGVVFSLVLWSEWGEMFISWGSLKGCLFFASTGLHGLHVLVGLLGLSLLWGVSLAWGFSTLGLGWPEVVIWYWHFVDLMWLAVFMVCYWYSM